MLNMNASKAKPRTRARAVPQPALLPSHAQRSSKPGSTAGSTSPPARRVPTRAASIRTSEELLRRMCDVGGHVVPPERFRLRVQPSSPPSPPPLAASPHSQHSPGPQPRDDNAQKLICAPSQPSCGDDGEAASPSSPLLPTAADVADMLLRLQDELCTAQDMLTEDPHLVDEAYDPPAHCKVFKFRPLLLLAARCHDAVRRCVDDSAAACRAFARLQEDADACAEEASRARRAAETALRDELRRARARFELELRHAAEVAAHKASSASRAAAEAAAAARRRHSEERERLRAAAAEAAAAAARLEEEGATAAARAAEAAAALEERAARLAARGVQLEAEKRGVEEELAAASAALREAAAAAAVAAAARDAEKGTPPPSPRRVEEVKAEAVAHVLELVAVAGNEEQGRAKVRETEQRAIDAIMQSSDLTVEELTGELEDQQRQIDQLGRRIGHLTTTLQAAGNENARLRTTYEGTEGQCPLPNVVYARLVAQSVVARTYFSRLRQWATVSVRRTAEAALEETRRHASYERGSLVAMYNQQLKELQAKLDTDRRLSRREARTIEAFHKKHRAQVAADRCAAAAAAEAAAAAAGRLAIAQQAGFPTTPPPPPPPPPPEAAAGDRAVSYAALGRQAYATSVELARGITTFAQLVRRRVPGCALFAVADVCGKAEGGLMARLAAPPAAADGGGGEAAAAADEGPLPTCLLMAQAARSCVAAVNGILTAQGAAAALRAQMTRVLLLDAARAAAVERRLRSQLPPAVRASLKVQRTYFAEKRAALRTLKGGLRAGCSAAAVDGAAAALLKYRRADYEQYLVVARAVLKQLSLSSRAAAAAVAAPTTRRRQQQQQQQQASKKVRGGASGGGGGGGGSGSGGGLSTGQDIWSLRSGTSSVCSFGGGGCCATPKPLLRAGETAPPMPPPTLEVPESSELFAALCQRDALGQKRAPLRSQEQTPLPPPPISKPPGCSDGLYRSLMLQPLEGADETTSVTAEQGSRRGSFGRTRRDRGPRERAPLRSAEDRGGVVSTPLAAAAVLPAYLLTGCPEEVIPSRQMHSAAGVVH